LLDAKPHQSQLAPEENKFHKGNGDDGKHYWLTPWDAPEFVALAAEFGPFDFDPCPFPLPAGFDGLTAEWRGERIYVNPPFGSIAPPSGKGRKLGPTAWVRKAIAESQTVEVHPSGAVTPGVEVGGLWVDDGTGALVIWPLDGPVSLEDATDVLKVMLTDAYPTPGSVIQILP